VQRELRGVCMGGGVLAALVIILAWPGFAREGSAWLAQVDPPAQADLIVVVGGGARERFLTASRLFAQGYAPAILVTGLPGDEAAAREFLAGHGVPVSAILSSPGTSRSTYEDALLVRRAALDRGAGSILAVTSPYHCRRLRLLLSRALEGTRVSVRVTASESLYLDLSRWWTDRQGWVLIPAEYAKLAWAWAAATPPRDPPKVTGTP